MLLLKNRFAETVQILNDSQVSVVARPVLKRFIEVGTGHIRKLFAQAGVFTDDLFAISGTTLWRIKVDGSTENLGVLSTNDTADVSICATAPIGDTVPAYLFIAEGGVLWVWTDNGQALGHLHASGNILNNDTVTINGVYYKWTSGDVNTGTPDGTSGTPWLVALGTSNSDALSNLFNAINNDGDIGTDYSSVIEAHPDVFAYSNAANDLYVSAVVTGTEGNSYTLAETGANLAWDAATMSGGGENMLRQVQVPDDVGAISVATINSFVIAVPLQNEAIKGRFYYIRPGETKIDPLDYATAERSPDGVYQVVVYGDMFWLLGQDTAEPWLTTTDTAAPVSRYQGILYDRGTANGTGIQVKDSLVMIDQHGGVFQFKGGDQRISTPDLEELIRRSLQKAALLSSF